MIFGVADGIGAKLAEMEGGEADMKIALLRRRPRTVVPLKPHLHPAEAPLRKSYLLTGKDTWRVKGWEDWSQQSPAQRAQKIFGDFVLTIYGAVIGTSSASPETKEDGKKRRWDQVPRELKSAIRRLHENLGHATNPDMLRALRIHRASAAAIQAVRAFTCEECLRIKRPAIPRPSKLPSVDEFGVVIGFDTFSEKDAGGAEWQFLNIVCLGSSFQVVALLGDALKIPSATEVLEAYELSWGVWAGEPEV